MVRTDKPQSPITRACRDGQGLLLARTDRWAVGLPLLFILQPFIGDLRRCQGPHSAASSPSPGTVLSTNSTASCISARGPGNGCSRCSAMPESPSPSIATIISGSWRCGCSGSWFAWQEKPGVNRTRTFLSFMLIWWIGGSLLAIAFSSAGPCYFGRDSALRPIPYAPLMAYLDEVNPGLSDLGHRYAGLPVGRLCRQWRAAAGHLGHAQHAQCDDVADRARLLALEQIRPLPRHRPSWSLIFIGSIHLGWHYAIDAYLAWAITLAIWFATKPLAVWWESRPAARRLAAGGRAWEQSLRQSV